MSVKLSVKPIHYCHRKGKVQMYGMKQLKQNKINRLAASSRMTNDRFPPFDTLVVIEKEDERYA